MKKLMIAFAAVAMATAANAAAIAWSLNGISTDQTAASAFLLDGSKYSDFLALTSAEDLATFVANNTLSTGSIASSKRGGVIASGSYAGTAGQTYNVFEVVFNNADVSQATYYAYTAAEDASIPTSGDLTYSKAFATMTASDGWKAIPEPTSGLLLLLGMAGLALRRKQK